MTVHALTRSGVKPRHETYVQPGTGDPDGVLPDRVFVAGHDSSRRWAFRRRACRPGSVGGVCLCPGNLRFPG